MPYMELFVPKLDQHAPCFAISEKAYYHRKVLKCNSDVQIIVSMKRHKD